MRGRLRERKKELGKESKTKADEGDGEVEIRYGTPATFHYPGLDEGEEQRVFGDKERLLYGSRMDYGGSLGIAGC